MNKKKSIEELGRDTLDEFRHKEKFPLAVVLDNVRSLNNIGSIFRTCDAFCVSHLALCGITATPPSAEIHKTALGAEETVDWRHYSTTAEAIDALRRSGYTICALEQCRRSVSLETFQPQKGAKYAIVAGHEVYGVAQEVVDSADICLEIPQFGTKHSLNVSVSTAVALWQMVRAMITPA